MQMRVLVITGALLAVTCFSIDSYLGVKTRVTASQPVEANITPSIQGRIVANVGNCVQPYYLQYANGQMQQLKLQGDLAGYCVNNSNGSKALIWRGTADLQVFVTDLPSGTNTRLVAAETRDSFLNTLKVRGNSVTYTKHWPQQKRVALFEYDLTTGSTTEITTLPYDFAAFSILSPDHKKVASSIDGYTVGLFDIATRRLQRIKLNEAVRNFTWMPDGSTINVQTADAHHLYYVKTDGTQWTVPLHLPKNGGWIYSMSWSPDTQKAAVLWSDIDTVTLFIVNADGTVDGKLWEGPGSSYFPSGVYWSAK